MNRLSKVIIAFIPCFVTFGPLFIAIGATAKNEPLWHISFLGAAMTGIGLAFIFVQVMKQRKSIEELRAGLMNKEPGRG